jgi:hypothetical protein
MAPHKLPHIKAMATAICGRWWAMRGGDGDAETIQSRNRRASTVTGTRAAKLCGFSTTRLATLGGKDQSRKKAAQLRACTSSRHGRDASTFSMRAFHAA